MKLYTYWRSLATFRVRIALNLKGVKYEPVYVDLDGGQQNQSDYKAVNPQMVIPSLVEDDGNVLYQSLA
ncbi:MAG: maleylacetoacetate isomerase, partial [Sphingomonadales bacterium]|nr:maleylacetoacetate isomerase [Sphingomonadales bacterium]